MDYEDIRYQHHGQATWITIDRPEKRNAVRPRTYEELADAFLRADREEGTRFVVLTGAGDGFCAGDDFEEIFLADRRREHHEDRRLARYRDRSRAMNPVISEILRCEKPVIAAVGGAAVGMGLDLALVCDIRIASDTARFGSYFIRRGVLGTAGSYWFLPRLVGLGPAMELALSGVLIDAWEAHRIGLANRVVPKAELDAAVEAMIEQLSWGAPLAQRVAKRAMLQGLSMDWQVFDEHIAPLADGLWATEDHREGVQSHVERRPPRFHSR